MRDITRWSLATMLLALHGTACQPASETPEREIAAAPVLAESHGALATRREAQVEFDSARALVLSGKRAGAAAQLRAAAAFTKGHADSATGEVKTMLTRAARDLERLATSVEQGMVRSVEKLAPVFARAQSAETHFHLARADAAWTARQSARTGEELIISADHLERTARDAGQLLPASATVTLATIRELGEKLMRGTGFAEEEVENTLSAFRNEVRRFGTRVAVRKD